MSSAPDAIPQHERLAKRVLLIGWDSADWQLISPLLDSGKMPTLERFVSKGVMGNLASLKPILSPILWNSIATGKRPHKHGIYGFTEPKGDGSGIQPVTSTSRRCKALWNILSQNGLRTQVFGWFASHPAEPLPEGICVTDFFPRVSGPVGHESALAPDSVHPERLRDKLGSLRVNPHEIEGDHLSPFLRRPAEIDQTTPQHQHLLFYLQRVLAQCSSIHAAATWSLENEPWDFAAIYYEGLDLFCHGFMQFHPPRMEGTSEADFEFYQDVVTNVYRFHDLMLATLLKLAGEDTTVIILSDHGFYSDHLRPPIIPDAPPNPAAWHRPNGMIAVRGPGLLEDERIYGSTLLDIAPTVLALFGLPTGADMDGRVLGQIFKDPPKVAEIPSWDAVDGPRPAGIHPPDKQIDPIAAQEAIQQLVELGYVDAPGPDIQKTIAETVFEQQVNLATSYIDAGMPAAAVSVLEKLAEKGETKTRTTILLIQAYLSTGQMKEARRAIDGVLADRSKLEPDVAARADLFLGVVLAAEGRDDESLELLRRAEEVEPRLPGLHNQIGSIYLRKRLWSDAERVFRRALEIDGDYAPACNGLSVSLLRQDRLVEAAEYALRAVGLQHFFASAHFQLGSVLARLNWPERAAQAFEMGLQIRPGVRVAHRYLGRIYGRLGQAEKARMHRAAAAVPRKKVESKAD
ncbi:MAG: alkaline phosphatase family protein [Chthoniobacterales bacterium]